MKYFIGAFLSLCVIAVLLFTYLFYERAFVVIVIAITTYIAYHSRYKYIILSVLGVCIATLLIAIYSGSDKSKVPLSVPVDFSKKGTVYEADFQAPWNSAGSLVEFYMSAHIKWETPSSEEFRIAGYIRTGEYSDAEGKPILTKKTPYFRLKVTLTPLGWTSNDVTIWTRTIPNASFISKKFTGGEKIEFMSSVPLYGYGSTKTIMIADLQRLRNYHIRVESLEDVTLPKGATTSFAINRLSAIH